MLHFLALSLEINCNGRTPRNSIKETYVRENMCNNSRLKSLWHTIRKVHPSHRQNFIVVKQRVEQLSLEWTQFSQSTRGPLAHSRAIAIVPSRKGSHYSSTRSTLSHWRTCYWHFCVRLQQEMSPAHNFMINRYESIHQLCLTCTKRLQRTTPKITLECIVKINYRVTQIV